jgi:hypothetical protein
MGVTDYNCTLLLLLCVLVMQMSCCGTSVLL